MSKTLRWYYPRWNSSCRSEQQSFLCPPSCVITPVGAPWELPALRLALSWQALRTLRQCFLQVLSPCSGSETGSESSVGW